MDRHEEKKAREEKERTVTHFSDETPKLCVHTASSCCAAQMYNYLFMPAHWCCGVQGGNRFNTQQDNWAQMVKLQPSFQWQKHHFLTTWRLFLGQQTWDACGVKHVTLHAFPGFIEISISCWLLIVKRKALTCLQLGLIQSIVFKVYLNKIVPLLSVDVRE